MTPGEFRAALKASKLTVRAAAEALDVAPSTIQRWAEGESRIPADAAERIAALATGSRTELARTLGQLARVLEKVLGKPLPRDVAAMLQGETAEAFALLFRRVFEGPPERRKAREDAIMALTDRIADFPARLSNEEMAAFWVGYYGGGTSNTD